MYFLLDAENVNAAGFVGSYLLQPSDHVCIFYSANDQNKQGFLLDRHILEDIRTSGAHTELYRLKNHGKNALDFYIAVHVGRLIEQQPDAVIAIISKDKGYQGIKDYARIAVPTCRITCQPCIRSAIISMHPDADSRRIAEQNPEKINIETYFAQPALPCADPPQPAAPAVAAPQPTAAAEAQPVPLAAVPAPADDAGSTPELDKILESLLPHGHAPRQDVVYQVIYEQKLSRKDAYLSFLHCFGAKDGLVIYNAVKHLIPRKQGRADAC